MSLKQWFKKKFKKSPDKMTDEEWEKWEHSIQETLRNMKMDTTKKEDDKRYNLLEYCPYCGNITMIRSGPLCSYCKHKMIEVPEKQFTIRSLMDEELDRRKKVREETGEELGFVIDWETDAYERLKIEENPQFNPSLRNLRLYKQKKLSDPCVECPVCGSMNTYFLDPDRKTEYTGLFGGTNSNYGKTFGCVTCGHKW